MSSRKPTDLVNVDFWADRIAALIKLAEYHGMTVEITGGELVVSRQVSDAFIARTEVQWRPDSPAAEAQPGSDADLIEDYLKFLRGQGPEPDLSGLTADQRAVITGQFGVVKALADRDSELPPIDRDPVARRLGLPAPTAGAQQQPDTETPRCAAREPLDDAQCSKQDGHDGPHSDRPGRIWYPAPVEEECCGVEPPTRADDPNSLWGDCWCTLPPGHEGEHRCQPCTDRHGAPGWTDVPREPHPTEADLAHALAVLDAFQGQETAPPAVPVQPAAADTREETGTTPDLCPDCEHNWHGTGRCEGGSISTITGCHCKGRAL